MTFHARGATVTVRRTTPGGTDEYGDPIDGATTTHQIPGVAIAPRRAVPPNDRHSIDGEIVGYALMIPDLAADIAKGDEVQVYNDWCTVDASPARWVNPFGPGPDGLEVQVTFAQGV